MIDSRNAEDAIARDYEAQAPEADVTAIDCPEHIPSERGTTAVCTMRLADGETGEIVVEVLDEEGSISWMIEDVTPPGG